MRSRAAEVFPFTKSSVRNAVIVSFRKQGWGFKPTSSTEDSLIAKTGASIFSFGETIEIELVSVDEGHTEVRVESKTDWQVVDYGRNNRNLSKLYEAVQRELTAGRAPTVSAGRYCTACGSPAGTEQRFCISCGKQL